MPRMPRFLLGRATTGTAAIEFAVVVPVLVILVIGGADYAFMANQSATLAAAVRAGAQFARVSPACGNLTLDDPSGACTTDIQTVVPAYTTPALNSLTVSVGSVCSCLTEGGIVPSGGPTHAACAGSCAGTPFHYAQITASQTFTPVVAYTSLFFPGSVSAGTIVRVK